MIYFLAGNPQLTPVGLVHRGESQAGPAFAAAVGLSSPVPSTWAIEGESDPHLPL